MSCRRQHDPDAIVIASLRFIPFVSRDQVTPKCTTSLALKHISEKERTKLTNRLNEWIDNSVVLARTRTDASVLSPAALAIFYVQHHERTRRPLIVQIDDTVYPPKLIIALSQNAIPSTPTELVRPSAILQAIFWHHFRIAKQTDCSFSFEPNRCGFADCNGACCPEPPSKLLDFHLDRLYHKHTMASYKAESRLRERRSERLNVCSNAPLLSLPDDVLFRVVQNLSGADITRLSETCPTLSEFLLPVVPGLRLRLFPHQLHALRRLTAMEQLRVREDAMPLLERIDCPSNNGSCLAVDLVDGSVLWLDGFPCVGPIPGGLFCDEPGLGKTITALALILKTNGQLPSVSGQTILDLQQRNGTYVKVYKERVVERMQSYAQGTINFPDRKSRLFPDIKRHRASSRSIRQPDYLGLGRSDALPSAYESAVQTIYLSPATLIIVPHVLVEHWLAQIARHVDIGTLRVLYLKSRFNCPKSPAEIASKYDLIIASFDAIRAMHMEMRSSAPPLMRVHFLRIIVDEGHNLSSANITNFVVVCERLRAQSRWVMTGTPTPSTPRSDVDHLYSLLRFIREESYGMDRSAWEAGVRTPYLQFKREGLQHLGSLLKRIMIRADKRILSVKCDVRNVILDFSQASARSYNGLVRAVRRNLITSDWFSEEHNESLLNPKNYREAEDLFKNLKSACCFGGTMNMEFSVTDIAETLDILYEKRRKVPMISDSDRFVDPTFKLVVLDDVDTEVSEEEREEIVRNNELRERLLNDGKPYTRISYTPTLPRKHSFKIHENLNETVERITYAGRLHEIACAFKDYHSLCDRCRKDTTVPMVTPCGHLLCDECIVLDRRRCVAKQCGVPYLLDKNGVPEELIELQPSIFSTAWVKNWDDTVSAKLDYLIKRITELPCYEQWKTGLAEPEMVAPKVIVHSEYGDHLKMVAVKLKESELKDSYVEMTFNAAETEIGLKGRRASEIAENSVQTFRNDDNVNILLMNTKHGGVGLDLSFVRYIFLLEPVWDASVELQIISRAHRIGCKHDIVVERLVMRNSVEEAMLKESKTVLRASEIDVSGVAAARVERDRQRRANMLRTLRTVTFKAVVGEIENASNDSDSDEVREVPVEYTNGAGSKRKSNSNDDEDADGGRERRRVRFEL